MFGKKKEKACKNCSNMEAGRETSSRASSKSSSNAKNCEAGKEASRSSKSSRKCK